MDSGKAHCDRVACTYQHGLGRLCRPRRMGAAPPWSCDRDPTVKRALLQGDAGIIRLGANGGISYAIDQNYWGKGPCEPRQVQKRTAVILLVSPVEEEGVDTQYVRHQSNDFSDRAETHAEIVNCHFASETLESTYSISRGRQIGDWGRSIYFDDEASRQQSIVR